MEQFEVTSVSSKGQVVIPNTIRKQIGIETGSKLLVLTDGDNLLLKPIQAPKKKTFEALIKQSRKIAKQRGIKRKDLAAIIKADRDENRS